MPPFAVAYVPQSFDDLAALMRLMRVHGVRSIQSDTFSLVMAAQAAEPSSHEQPGTTTAEEKPERLDALDLVISGRIPGDPSADGSVTGDPSSS